MGEREHHTLSTNLPVVSVSLHLADFVLIMVDFIFDVQFMRDENNDPIPKEVAVVSLQGNVIGHWIIKAPHNFQDLPNGLKVMNNFCTVEIHGLEWFDGDVPIKVLKYHVCELVKNAKQIYARGCNNASFLESLICRHVINFENYHAPTFSKLQELFPSENTVCSSHASPKKPENFLNFCALNRVMLLKRWFHELLPANWENMDLQSSRAYNALREYSIENFEDGYDVVDDLLTDAATVGNDPSSNEDSDNE